MIVRQHTSGGCVSVVRYSDCAAYRYDLTRCWDQTAAKLLFIMLNPSQADVIQNDPTVARCERRARDAGFGAIRVANIFAWRDTDPHAMRRATMPVGPENDRVLQAAARWANQTVAAWGVHGAHRDRGAEVATRLRKNGHDMYHLGLTKDGHPRHPLYIGYATQPTLWSVK